MGGDALTRQSVLHHHTIKNAVRALNVLLRIDRQD